MAAVQESETPYPPHWEADVVLADGGTMHLRPIMPEDADRLVAFHSRLSEQTIYYRFFAAYPKLSPRDVERFTHVDHEDRAALVATLGDDIIAVTRYDRLPGTDQAEVAFVVEDKHQGRGIGSVLLEHLASVARERGIRKFYAEVLPGNRKMVNVFLDAGYQTQRGFRDGSVHLSFPIEPTASSLAVMQAREHRAEARSIERLLTPRSVAVIGASREPRSVGRVVFRDLLEAGFQGPVYPVNPKGGHVASVRAYPSVLDVPDDIDLAVVTTPAPAVPDIVADCARKQVRGLVVISSGFSETGPAGRDAERAMVTLARANGMRVIGPNCLGIINTAPEVSLNATLAPIPPARGRVGFFSQSGALGIAILETARQRGLGLSTFISAGNRADVSGNDMLQYWEQDATTDAVLLYLESFGNPRKFARLARRVARRKPIVAVKSGRTTARAPLGHVGAAVSVPDEAVGALFRQTGVIRVDTLVQLFDAAQVLAYQPLPGGRRVAILGNSAALGLLAADACELHALELASVTPETRDELDLLMGSQSARTNPLDLGASATPGEFDRALSTLLADPGVDAIVAVFIPPLTGPGAEVAAVLSQAAAKTDKPIVSTFLAFEGLHEQLRNDVDDVPGRGSLPSYASPERAVLALARAAEYADWRRRPEGTVPSFDDIEPAAARTLVEEALAAAPEGLWLPAPAAAEVFARYGVPVWSRVPVATFDEALAAAESLGWPVVLKATAAHLRHRSDLGLVRLGLGSERALRAAYDAVTLLGDEREAALVVQKMAPPGIATVVGVVEDPSFGALVSFGLGGVATDLLEDRAFRILPLTDVDVAELVRSVRAAPLLFGYRGADPVDVGALERLLLRVARLADDLPEIAEIDLNPVLVAPEGLSVLDARLRVEPPTASPELGPRRLRDVTPPRAF